MIKTIALLAYPINRIRNFIDNASELIESFDPMEQGPEILRIALFKKMIPGIDVCTRIDT